MNCEDARRTPLGPDARDHMRACPDCGLWRLANESPLPDVEKYAALVTCDLTAAKPLRSPAFYGGILLAASTLVILAGVAALGLRGWHASGATIRLFLPLCLVTGLAFSTALLASLMIPGARLRIRPSVTAAAIVAAFLAAVALYPWRTYEGFTHAAIACFAIGLGHAIPAAAAASWVLRQGMVLSRFWTCAIAGQFAGLTGLAVLFLFCPHLDAGHVLLGHVGMLIACTLIGAATAILLDRRDPPS